MFVEIKGLPDNPTVNGVDFSKLSAEEHKQAIFKYSPHNYYQISGWIVVGRGSNDWTLRIKRTRDGKEEEKEVLDFQTMYSTLNAGILNERIVKTVVEFLEKGHTPAIPRAIDHMFHAPALATIRALTGMDMVIMKSGGAETVETAVSIAFQYWKHVHGGETKNAEEKFPYIISAQNNFHGRTRMSRSLSTSDSSRKNIGPLIQHVIHVPFNDIPAMSNKLEKYRDNIAAVILEPIQGEGGVRMPHENYLKEVETLCRKHGVLFILDEIQTGFGRTGTDFAFEYYKVKPDLLCGGKAAGAGIVPVSFVAGKKEVMSVIKPGTEGATWSATPIQCLAIMLAIKELSDNKLAAQSAEKGAYMFSLLQELAKKYPDIITDVRGKGLFIGIDTIHEGKKLSAALLEGGLWAKETGEDGKTMRLSPPLIIPKEEIQKAVAIFEKVIMRLKA
ncbi:MAG: aspartate aminotransferase family protein [Parcubacteria group bacterium]|nr:aspartate aminotransferase family protein [Parcubacteria group bacterium]